jgi:outer membrane protein OmpA-like peptidoglycan-associated protein
MKKLLLFTAVACMAVTAAFGQKDKSGIEYQNLRGPFITNSFGDNWFISAGGGFDYWAPTVKKPWSGAGNASWVAQLGVGKWLHPYYGVRAQFNYGKTHPFNYWSIETDVLFHLSNAIGGYKEARFYNAVLVGGFGYLHGFADNKSNDNELTFNAGLMNTFRLASGLDAYLELKAVAAPGRFMAANAGRLGLIPSATIGLTYKFKDRSFYTAKCAIDKAVGEATAADRQRIGDLQSELAAAQARNERLKAEANKAPVVEKVVEKVAEDVPFTIFFPIGQSELKKFDVFDLYHIADIIKANPGKTYTISGYADKETGTAQVNEKVSKARAESVRKALVEKAGVNPDQLTVKAYGDTAQPFDKNFEMNRAVIIE